MPVLCQEYMLFFCLPLSSQPRLRLLRPLSISQHISAYRKNKGGAGGSGRGRASIFIAYDPSSVRLQSGQRTSELVLILGDPTGHGPMVSQLADTRSENCAGGSAPAYSGHLPLNTGCMPTLKRLRRVLELLSPALPLHFFTRPIILVPWDRQPHLMQITNPCFQHTLWDLWILCPAHTNSDPTATLLGISGYIPDGVVSQILGPGHWPWAIT